MCKYVILFYFIFINLLLLIYNLTLFVTISCVHDKSMKSSYKFVKLILNSTWPPPPLATNSNSQSYASETILPIIQTDWQTDGRTDRVIPVYPLNFVAGGIINPLWPFISCVVNIVVSAFRGMHVSPAKHSYVCLPRKRGWLLDRQSNKVIPIHVYR